jgi:hypothetical protein
MCYKLINRRHYANPVHNDKTPQTLFAGAGIFMQMSRNFRGQHINSCSQVIHKLFPVNKINVFLFFTHAAVRSDRLFADFSSANSQHVLYQTYKNFPVANLSRLG